MIIINKLTASITFTSCFKEPSEKIKFEYRFSSFVAKADYAIGFDMVEIVLEKCESLKENVDSAAQWMTIDESNRAGCLTYISFALNAVLCIEYFFHSIK